MKSNGHIIVVGLGNIGSALVGHLARMKKVGKLTLIDPDRYESHNLSSQQIVPDEVGRYKTECQARRARAINPALDICSYACCVEEVPLGLLMGSMILACLDSRESRRVVNQIAWRLGIPWIDAGIDTFYGLLVRVRFYKPGKNSACLECSWSDEDYAALEQVYPCQPKRLNRESTNAPTGLGAIAAAYQAIACEKYLSGEDHAQFADREILLEAATHKSYVTSFKKNPDCRFNHEIWEIQEADTDGRDPSFAALWDFLNLDPEDIPFGEFRVEGQNFINALTCPVCHEQIPFFYLQGRLLPDQLFCKQCGGSLVARGFDMQTQLKGSDCSQEQLSQSLGRIGARNGDVVHVADQMKRPYFLKIKMD